MDKNELALEIEKILSDVVNKGLMDEKDTAMIIHEQATLLAERLCCDEDGVCEAIAKELYDNGYYRMTKTQQEETDKLAHAISQSQGIIKLNEIIKNMKGAQNA